jgi:protein involved in polysaccharide export with SLBB domain
MRERAHGADRARVRLRSTMTSSSRTARAVAWLAAGIFVAFAGACVHVPPLAEGTAPATAFTREGNPAAYTLGPGDTLNVFVYGHADLVDPRVPLRLDPEGRLHLPLSGAIELSGLSIGAARERIETALAAYLVEPAVGLSVAEYAARRAYVLGEVGRPGAIVLDRPLTALQALSLAGGVTEVGDRSNVAIVRVVGEDVQVAFFDAATPGIAGLFVIEPEDLLFVRLSKGGAFREQIVPVLQAAAPIFSSITNLVVIVNALSD